MNLMLPPLPDREALLGFRVSIAVLAGAGVGIGTRLLGLPTPAALALGAGAAVGLVIVSGRRERTAGKAYRIWNRAAKGYAGRARRMITAIWYWSVFTMIGRTGGGSLALDRSPWRARQTLASDAYADPGGAPTDREGSGGMADLARWAIRTRRPWALVFIPLFGLLTALDTKGRKKPLADIYTLY